MTRATLTKLLLLVLLAFIICLPEFFTLYRVLKVKLTCWPDQPRGGGSEKWEKVCTTMDPERATGDEDQERSWFRCETDTDPAKIHANVSPSGTSSFRTFNKTVHLTEVHAARGALYMQVSLELHFGDAEALNLTLWGLSNHNSLHLHPPEEEEVKEVVKEAGGETKVFYCCYPRPTSSESATPGLCLLWLSNQTALRGAAHKQLLLAETDEWHCARVLWLVLLCVVLLILITSLFGQICMCKKPQIYPVHQYFTGQHLNGTPHRIEETLFWTEMPPIEEVPSQDEIETLLDLNNEQSFTANLHHRCHHVTSPPTADRPCERQPFH